MMLQAGLAIVRNWQAAIDRGLETGEAPVLDGGGLPMPLDGAGQLLALAELADQRREATTPLLAVGGVAPWWLVLLMRPSSAPVQAPDPTVAFTGTDPAMQQAALATWDRRQSPYRDQPGALPVALQPPFTPGDRPAAAAPWEALPFALGAATPAPRDGWVAWTAVVIVLILLILAALM